MILIFLIFFYVAFTLFHFNCIYRNGIQGMSIIFSKPEKRTQWEQVFNEAKQKLGPISMLKINFDNRTNN